MVLTDQDEAIRLLAKLIDADVAPIVINPDEVIDLLNAAKVSSLWGAATSYAFGQVVQPTAANSNGRRFRVARLDGSGTSSGATEPAWTTSVDATVSDGDITWQEDGRAYESLWDLPAAARAGWLLKASRVTTCTDFEQDGTSFSSSQVYDHCIEQADKYVSPMVA